MKTEDRILAAVKRLEGIARQNNDSWSFAIHIDTRPTWGNRHFQFICKENSDGHDVVSCGGQTLEEVADRLEDTQEIDGELGSFGYDVGPAK